MNFLIEFLLISALLIVIVSFFSSSVYSTCNRSKKNLLIYRAKTNPLPLTATDIEEVIKKRQSLITEFNLKLNEGGKLSENNNAIVWEGTEKIYNNIWRSIQPTK